MPKQCEYQLPLEQESRISLGHKGLDPVSLSLNVRVSQACLETGTLHCILAPVWSEARRLPPHLGIVHC